MKAIYKITNQKFLLNQFIKLGGIMNSYTNSLKRKKTTGFEILELLMTVILVRVMNKIIDYIYSFVKNSINSIQDLYRWKKEAHVCSLLDTCEEIGEWSGSGNIILGVTSFGLDTCGGCFERFACQDNKLELIKAIKFDAEISGDVISDENANLSAEDIIKDHDMFYKVKKIKTPILLIKKAFSILKWKWGELRFKHIIVGCKRCGITWISDLDYRNDACPNCSSRDRIYPITPGKSV